MNILITGCSQGIGRELVKLFLEKGNQVVGFSRNESKLKLLEEEVQELTGTFKYVSGSLSDEEDRKKLSVLLNEEALDVLINNAGLLINKPFEAITEQELKQVYDVNIFGPFQLVQEVLPNLKLSSLAHIVNISSMGGFQGSAKFPGLSAYSSSKAAIASLTECLAEEFKEMNIKCNALCLGAAQTEMLEQAFPGYQAPLSAFKMAKSIAQFAFTGHQAFNGKVLPMSVSTP